MKKIECTFYRPGNVSIREFQNIVGKLENDLNIICTENITKSNVCAYVSELVRFAKPLKKNPDMYYLGLDEPDRMPGDARVDYFYRPTYLGCAFIMKAILLYPDIIEGCSIEEHPGESEEKNLSEIFRGLMLGCTGRSFMGYGFDDLKGMINTLLIFSGASACDFISRYPAFCREFTDLYKLSIENLKEKLDSGMVCNAWGEDYSDVAREVLNANNKIIE